MGAIVVVTTVGTEEQANLLGEELVRRRHAACVNALFIPRTIYRWKGEVCTDSEYLLMIKTQEEQFEAVDSTIREIHSYEIPEILAFPVLRGGSDFLQWISTSLDKRPAPDGDAESGP